MGQELVLAGDRTPQEWADQINTEWRKSAESIVRTGQLLDQAVRALPHGQVAQLYERLDFSRATASRLTQIGTDARISNVAHVQQLPQSWGTLYELTKLDDTQWQRALNDGLIRPDLERNEIISFRRQLANDARALKRAPAERLDLPTGGDHLILHGDCLKLFPEIPDSSVDLVATDPPYNLDKAYWDSYGNGEEFAEWAVVWLAECKRVLSPHGALYVFGVNRMLSHLQHWLDDEMVYRNWIVWDTIQGAGGGLWTNRYESVLYYSKTSETYEDAEAVKLERHEENIREYGGKVYQFKNPSNVWRFPAVDSQHRERTAHPTQKPVELMQRIIRASCPPGGVVVDPFAGSGTTVIAALREGRKAIGMELDEENYRIAVDRLSREISG